MTTEGIQKSATPGLDVGNRIRAFREARRLSLRGLAQRAQMSPGFLSEVERGQSNISISSLMRLAGPLGLTMADFFAEDTSPDHRVLRRDARPEIPTASGARKYLISQRPLRSVEVYAGQFSVGGSTGDEAYTHGDSQEILVVVHGAVRCTVGDSQYTLVAGDSIEYQTSTPHKIENVQDEPAEVMWIVAPPTTESNS